MNHIEAALIALIDSIEWQLFDQHIKGEMTNLINAD